MGCATRRSATSANAAAAFSIGRSLRPILPGLGATARVAQLDRGWQNRSRDGVVGKFRKRAFHGQVALFTGTPGDLTLWVAENRRKNNRVQMRMRCNRNVQSSSSDSPGCAPWRVQPPEKTIHESLTVVRPFVQISAEERRIHVG